MSPDDAPKKKYLFRRDEQKLLVMGGKGAVASDAVTVDSGKVGYMYRAEPYNETDSGWRLLSGDETQEYMEDENNHGFFDLNLLANLDPTIAPHLNAPVGSAFEWAPDENRFFEVDLETDCA